MTSFSKAGDPARGEKEHASAVKEMFAGIAGRYDLLNHLLSANIDKRWRRKVAGKLGEVLADKNALILDVACGTGDLSIELQSGNAARVTGTDFCRPMLEIAEEKSESSTLSIPFVEGDGMNLAFADSTFDAVTIAFGLRNFANWENGIEELYRVLKPSGKLVILEFSSPVVPGFKQAFRFYFSSVLPRIGGIISGSRGAYEYLPDSVSRFPDQEGLASLMRQIGFSNVEYKNLTGGIAAIHSGTK
ncbi:MAG: bifunctional demethylmenaquinone methyltransferase/2-methoxy-6-polyprenyl-1,4-benzoquinol methylase UbiE [Acidobacteria bacterium]|nr:MAG: bifunctional demethylmenaquinone methyltransferase/2-methoxy-6-polyprenyl-1,4-benzoquinol methylase UbiE [Acidobacteriota bacterium]REK01633.1 MAG: bifunctional demethylmenaquinone methyltransferase/2-methoxy-6-polyprenyl-1,4-benzoquinol methylase UbiE [Acidobacteriota bacterium]REK14589.1 MAG: bifunctional demethylmenaquinone methyltransferase/2-methoxy-6-polyprenyl-1,4-benzoquinol methylase UbiE [Acidobacteriota bacterium]REK45304.1 MAG: bifunctional demethylmenaquinone methyltransfera